MIKAHKTELKAAGADVWKKCLIYYNYKYLIDLVTNKPAGDIIEGFTNVLSDLNLTNNELYDVIRDFDNDHSMATVKLDNHHFARGMREFAFYAGLPGVGLVVEYTMLKAIHSKEKDYYTDASKEHIQDAVTRLESVDPDHYLGSPGGQIALCKKILGIDRDIGTEEDIKKAAYYFTKAFGYNLSSTHAEKLLSSLYENAPELDDDSRAGLKNWLHDSSGSRYTADQLSAAAHRGASIPVLFNMILDYHGNAPAFVKGKEKFDTVMTFLDNFDSALTDAQNYYNFANPATVMDNAPIWKALKKYCEVRLSNNMKEDIPFNPHSASAASVNGGAVAPYDVKVEVVVGLRADDMPHLDDDNNKGKEKE